MKYVFAVPERFEIKEYEFSSYEVAGKWVNKKIEEFIDKNHVTRPEEDFYFLKFKSDLQGSLQGQLEENTKKIRGTF